MPSIDRVLFRIAGRGLTGAKNPAGEITGVYVAGGCLPAACSEHGFVRDGRGTITSFDVPGDVPPDSIRTYPTSISPAGEITGYYEPFAPVKRGFVRDRRGTITTIDVPGAFATRPFSINPAGEITGDYSFHGLVWRR